MCKCNALSTYIYLLKTQLPEPLYKFQDRKRLPKLDDRLRLSAFCRSNACLISPSPNTRIFNFDMIELFAIVRGEVVFFYLSVENNYRQHLPSLNGTEGTFSTFLNYWKGYKLRFDNSYVCRVSLFHQNFYDYIFTSHGSQTSSNV